MCLFLDIYYFRQCAATSDLVPPSPVLLPVPHLQHKFAGDCLVACAAMASLPWRLDQITLFGELVSD